MKPVVVHITADHPDAWKADKTRAIAALVDGTGDQFEHRVYSLNRHGSGLAALLAPGRVTPVADDGRLASWLYAQLPRGIFLAAAMRRVARTIVADLCDRDLTPALIHGHKLSFEGIAAREVAREMGLPYAITLQGNTDQKVLASRPDLHFLYRKVWREARAIVAFAPWIARWCEQRLGPSQQAVVVLPCVPSIDDMIAPQASEDRILSAFHLAHWRIKNLPGLAKASVLTRQHFQHIRLEIAGGADPTTMAEVENAIKLAGAEPFARLMGRMEPEAIQSWMNQGAVFVMPSKRESFGMVFVEALLAGCPIVYPRGAAVDGYFDGCSFAERIDSRDPEDISAAINRMLKNNAACKSALREWQTSGAADRFRRKTILADYTRLLETLTSPETK